MSKILKFIGSSVASYVVAIASCAWALEGISVDGTGVIQRSLAGGGVAHPEDATTLSLNPAGLVDVGTSIDVSAEFFAPTAGYSASGTGFIAPGDAKSNANLFVLPSLFMNYRIDSESAIGVGLYANEGAGTSYHVFNVNTNSPGVFGAGKTAIEYLQGHLAVGYARKFGDISVGVAPILSIQRFHAEGLGPFASFSTDPGSVSDRGYDWGVGFGIRGGAVWKISPTFRVAVAGTTSTYSTKFEKYSGLLASGGELDGVANITAGASWDVSQDLTLIGEYKRIFYSGIPTLGNASSIPPLLGAGDGPGFHYNDLNIGSIGLIWRVSPGLTLRAGYAHNNQPIRTETNDLVLNLLAPVTFTDRFAGGLTWAVDRGSSLGVAFNYSPRQTVSGYVPEALGGGKIDLSASYIDVVVGYSYKFNAN